jgi:hypothetical protein
MSNATSNTPIGAGDENAPNNTTAAATTVTPSDKGGPRNLCKKLDYAVSENGDY